jgi:DNA mismatch repair protein MutS
MHAVKEGPANRSFGLQVGALAGLPKPVIAQARRYLEALERRHEAAEPITEPRQAKTSPQLALFAPSLPSPAEEMLRTLDPDTMSPKDALDALYRLKSLRP